jgi:Na+-driven multidrug efflux pump
MLLSFANAALITLPLGFWLAEGQSLGPAGVFIASLVSSITGTALMGVWLWSGRWTRGRRP